MTNADIAATSRVNGSFVDALERPLLWRLAGRLPQYVQPDMLTMFGLLGALITFIAYGLTRWNASFLWLATLGLIFNWLGDSLDGTLARLRGIERPDYGFFIDHTTDLASMLLIGFGLALSPFVRFDVVCIELVAYLLLASFSFVCRSISGTMRISYLGIGPTEIRCAMILLNVFLLFERPAQFSTFLGAVSPVDLAIIAFSVWAFVAFAISAVGEARRLAVKDPPRDRGALAQSSFPRPRTERP